MDRHSHPSNPHGIERRGAPLAEAQVIAPQTSQRPSPVVARNMMRRQSDRGFNLGTLLGLLLRRRKTVLAVFSLLFLPVVAYVLTREAKYEAELRLILKRAPAPGVAAAGGVAGVSEADAQAEIELLKSRELYEQAGKQAGVIPASAKPREVALAVARLESTLKIAQVGKTNIISVRYNAPLPEPAAAVPNALAELYLRKHIELHSNDEAARFFTEQTSIYQRQLEAAQTALARFRQTGDVTLLQDQKQAYLRRATDLEAALQEAESSLRDAEQRVTLLARQRDQQPATVETGSRIARNSATSEKLKSLLIDLNNKRTELLTKYDAGYRLVKEVDRQIADTRAALERESAPQVVDQTNAPNPLRQNLESELLRTQSQIAGLKARRETLKRDLWDYRGRQNRLESATANHNDLERAVKIAEENFMLYQRKLEEARLAEALDKQRLMNVAILEKAAVPVLAASQHRTYLLLFGFLAAAFLALASAFVSDYLERHMPTRESLLAQAEAQPEAAAPPVAAAPEPAAMPLAPPVVENLSLPASSAQAVVPVVAVAPDPGPAPAAPPPRREVPLRPAVVEPIDRKRPVATPPSAPSKVTTNITVTREEVDIKTGHTTTTAVVVRNADAWRELFDRRSRGALARQKQAGVATTNNNGNGNNNKIDADFLRRIQDKKDKKTSGRDHRTGTRG